MRNKKIQLGSMEISLLAGLEHDNKTTFTFEGAFSKLSTKRQVVRNVLSRLNRKGRINRIRKGLYMLVPFKSQTWSQNELSLVPLLAKGGYVSFWSALSFWSLTEQLPKTVYVATGFSQKQREFEAVSFKFVHLASRYLFGEIEVKINGIAVKMASKEKAILDCLLHPEYCWEAGWVLSVWPFACAWLSVACKSAGGSTVGSAERACSRVNVVCGRAVGKAWAVGVKIPPSKTAASLAGNSSAIAKPLIKIRKRLISNNRFIRFPPATPPCFSLFLLLGF